MAKSDFVAKDFGKEILASAQNTFNHELENPKGEAKKTVSLLLDAVVTRITEVLVGFFGTFFFLFGLVFALQQQLNVPLWISSFGISVVASVFIAYTFLTKEKKNERHKRLRMDKSHG